MMREGAAGALHVASDAKLLHKIKEYLKKTPTGAAALDMIERANIKVVFVSGSSPHWDGEHIVLDRTYGAALAALSLVHEAQHAQTTLSGNDPDPTKETRDEYVRKMLEDELRSSLATMRVRRELERAVEYWPYLGDREEGFYDKAYEKAVAEAWKASPLANPLAFDAAGQKAGEDAVRQRYLDGSIRPAYSARTNYSSYVEYYTSAWQDGQTTINPAPQPN